MFPIIATLIILIMFIKSLMAFGFLNVAMFCLCVALAIAIITSIIRLLPAAFHVSVFIFSFVTYALIIALTPALLATYLLMGIDATEEINSNISTLIIVSVGGSISAFAYLKTKNYAMIFFRHIASRD